MHDDVPCLKINCALDYRKPTIQYTTLDSTETVEMFKGYFYCVITRQGARIGDYSNKSSLPVESSLSFSYESKKCFGNFWEEKI